MTLLLAWIGAATASLLCLVVDRSLAGEKLATVRSRCACGRELGILEVVPVLSWVVLRGRSKCCKVRLPARWPLEELFTGIAFYIGGHLVPLWGVVLSVGALGVVGVIEIYSQAREASFAGGPVLADASEPRRLEI